MFVGIDIGGTFTDIAAVHQGKIIYQHKAPTTKNILDCVLTALDCLLENINKETIKRLCISTTLITNAIVQNRLPDTSLIIMPGPGANTENSFPVTPYTIKGYINHLGNITNSPNLRELDNCICANNIAVSGKFSVRNPENERVVTNYLQNKYPDHNIVGAHTLSGKLNFIRRTNTAYYAAATKKLFAKFAQQIKQALKARDLNIPLVILKADAGTIDIAHAVNTAEFVFTGPAASVLGIKALIKPQEDCIALDIGGTTTDISFWRGGAAVLNNKGAQINGFNTSINTFYLHSLGLGGNSLINILEDNIYIGPDVSMNCVCLGGNQLTLTDILVLLGRLDIGDGNLVRKYLQQIGQSENFAIQVFDLALTTIFNKLQEMVAELNRTPVYTVSDLINPQVFVPFKLIGVGGAAAGILPALAQKMNINHHIPKFAPVANALGAALAKPTLLATIQVNTLAGYYTLSQDSVRYYAGQDFDKNKAQTLLLEHMRFLALSANIQLPEQEIEIVEFEEYPILAGYSDTGLVINMTMQIKPDILENALIMGGISL